MLPHLVTDLLSQFDSNGNTGGCQDKYTIIPAEGIANCANATLPSQLDVEGIVHNGPISRYGWIEQVCFRTTTFTYPFSTSPKNTTVHRHPNPTKKRNTALYVHGTSARLLTALLNALAHVLHPDRARPAPTFQHVRSRSLQLDCRSVLGDSFFHQCRRFSGQRVVQWCASQRRSRRHVRLSRRKFHYQVRYRSPSFFLGFILTDRQRWSTSGRCRRRRSGRRHPWPVYRPRLHVPLHAQEDQDPRTASPLRSVR